MKKIFIAMAAIVCSMSVNAQTMKVMKGDQVVATYTAEQADKVVFEEATAPATDPNLLPGEFTVAEGKTVKFTRSNLYWDGSAFKFEANQTDYQTSWDTNHVSHFYWSKTAAASYEYSYYYSDNSTSDVPFFAESKGGLTVEGTEGLYALSKNEWKYLLNKRTVNGGTGEGYSWKQGVTIAGKTNCLIIAPDGYTGSIASSYDTEEDWATAEALGLVCLPAAGCRDCSLIYLGGDRGYFWTATPYTDHANYAYNLGFRSGYADPTDYIDRGYGLSLRLVK